MMTTRCQHCGVQYALPAPDDATQLVEDLVCGHCGRLLTVAKTSEQAAAPAPWLVRQLSGSVFAPPDQPALERWIREGRVSRDDLLSQDGTTWQRLGNIVELAPLFGSGEPPMPSSFAQSGLKPVGAAAAVGPIAPPRPSRPTQAMPRVAAQPAEPSFYMPHTVSLAHHPKRPTGPRTTATRETYDSFADDSDEPTIFAFPSGTEDAETHALRPAHGASRWLFVVFLAVGIGAAGTYVTQPPWLSEAIAILRRAPVPHAVVAEVGNGYKALDRDSMQSLSVAMASFERASRMDYRFADARAGLAETELAIAEAFNTSAEDLSQYAAGQPKKERLRLQAESVKQRDAGAQHAARALTAAKEALALAPESVAANRALALYYAVRGASDKLQQPLGRARAAAPNDARVLYVTGLAALAKDPAAARTAFEQAVLADPQFNRALYRLARLEMAQKQNKAAASRVEAVLSNASDHAQGQALLAILEPSAHAEAGAPPILAFNPPRDPVPVAIARATEVTNPPKTLASTSATPLAVAEAQAAVPTPAPTFTPPLPAPGENAPASAPEPEAKANPAPQPVAVAAPAPEKSAPAEKPAPTPAGPAPAPAPKPAVPTPAKVAAAAKLSQNVTPPVAAPVAVQGSYADLINQARGLHDAHKPQDALPLYTAAIERDHGNPVGYIGLGWCQVETHDIEGAKQSFSKALQLAPRLADAHFGMAEALRQDNERREAIKQYRQYLSIEPGGAMAQLARQELEDLSK